MVFFGCAESSLLGVGFLQLQSTGSRLSGFNSCSSWTQQLQCVERGLELRLSSCAAQAQLLCGMQDPLRPGIKPVSPASARGFLATGPPGKFPAPSL